MLLCIAASPALRLAPPVMQLRQADSASVGTAGFAAGRGVPMMAVEQHGQSAAFPCHCLLPGPPGLLHAFSRRASATWTPAAALGTAVSACQKSPISRLLTNQVEQVKFTGNAVAVDGVVTAMSGNAMEDMWEKSRGRPLRRSLALWLFSMKATWKIIRAHKSEAKQIKVAAWVRQHAQRDSLALPQLASYAWWLWAACTPRGAERPAHRAPRHTSRARAAAAKVAGGGGGDKIRKDRAHCSVRGDVLRGVLTPRLPKSPIPLPLAIQVRDELLRLGPTMIKLGQVASARTDLLSQPYIDALVALQDSVHRIGSYLERNRLL